MALKAVPYQDTARKLLVCGAGGSVCDRQFRARALNFVIDEFRSSRRRTGLSWRSTQGGPVITCRIWFGALALVVAAAPAFAQQPQSAAGRIKIASGSAFIVRAGAVVPAQAGQLVFEADSVRTGADGRLGITLRDDTRFPRAWQRSASGPVRLRSRRRRHGNGAQGRARRDGVRLRTDRQALARLHPPRNAGRSGGRSRNDAGASSRPGMNHPRPLAVSMTVLIAAWCRAVDPSASKPPRALARA